jgi:Mg2+ and Co2+ transporter CorA
MESLAEVDKASYFHLRKTTAWLSDALKEQGVDFDDNEIEDALETVHSIDSFFFDQRLIYASLLSVRSKALAITPEAGRFELAALAAENVRAGVAQLQSRIENLQQQHMLDVQSLTDRNLRVLTVLSAIFLPLTLISGIYGMNFENMPELDESNAYFLVLSIMGVIAIGMTAFFYVKGWFK